MDASEIPDADDLTIGVSPDGKWLAFDFKVGDKRAVITMRSGLMPKVVDALMTALRDDGAAG